MLVHPFFAVAAALAAAAHALPAGASAEAKDTMDSSIAQQDAENNCLPRAVQGLSNSRRQALDQVARELRNSPFRDFHEFAPAALALNRPEIESKILGPNYPGTISGLLELRDLFRAELPEFSGLGGSQYSEDTQECGAPTAKNLRVIYTNLDSLVSQFV
ncbi:hypothetical protein GQ54DRAFT_310911 [Martensiomyces pterosporus]|nr:hypothetical protein GQ54DRAFT_310911 [Martensiomyces pterosporus]